MMKFYNIMYFCATFESLDPFTEFTRGIIDDTRAKLFIYKQILIYFTRFFIIRIIYVISASCNDTLSVPGLSLSLSLFLL